MHLAELWPHILLIIFVYADAGENICTFYANILCWSLSSCSASEVLVKAKIKRVEEGINKKQHSQTFPKQIAIARHFEATKMFLLKTWRLEVTPNPHLDRKSLGFCPHCCSQGSWGEQGCSGHSAVAGCCLQRQNFPLGRCFQPGAIRKTDDVKKLCGRSASFYFISLQKKPCFQGSKSV